VAQRPRTEETAPESAPVEKPEPIGSVRRELTRPDGTRVVVEVPVYPPFRLAERSGARPPPRGRSAPSLKRRRGAAKGRKPE
jgi:hypothetical protein